jgi:hypothetical protein
MHRKASLFITLLGLLTGSIAMPAFGQWLTSIPKDEMTGEQNIHAHSPVTAAMKQMSFPYDNITAWLGVGCDSQEEWAFIGFSAPPVLIDTSTDEGYHRISTRVKWDDQVEKVTLKQKWNSPFIHFSDDRAAISRITGSSTIQLELNWHGQGNTNFQFSLAGASTALARIRQACAG